MVPLTMHLPAAVFIYFITSGVFSFAFGLVARQPVARQMLGIPVVDAAVIQGQEADAEKEKLQPKKPMELFNPFSRAGVSGASHLSSLSLSLLALPTLLLCWC